MGVVLSGMTTTMEHFTLDGGEELVPDSFRGLLEHPTSSGVRYPELDYSSSMNVVSFMMVI